MVITTNLLIGNVVVKKEVLHSLLSENDDLKKEADKNNVILDFLSSKLSF